MSLPSCSHVKVSMVLMRAGHFFILFIRSLMNINWFRQGFNLHPTLRVSDTLANRDIQAVYNLYINILCKFK